MRKAAHFFLGANSSRGFSSLYDGLLEDHFDDLLILKGGPGCGKSTFMKQIAERCELSGETVDYIHCSGDPQSLDGIIIPDRRVGIVDGTAPHIVEPKYAIVRERYVDFSRFYDLDKVKAQKQTACLYYRQYKAKYQEAYRVLRAYGVLDAERKKMLAGIKNSKQTLSYIKKITRDLGDAAQTGTSAEIFLGGLTHEGAICRYDTVDALCKQVYEIVDPYGVADTVLSEIAKVMETAGEQVLICRDPLIPERIAHLLLPHRSLAIVTSNDLYHYPQRAYRKIRFSGMAEQKLTRAEKGKLHLIGNLQKSICNEAVLRLKEAKTAHDLLEEVYHPYVDFDAVSDLAEKEANRILH